MTSEIIFFECGLPKGVWLKKLTPDMDGSYKSNSFSTPKSPSITSYKSENYLHRQKFELLMGGGNLRISLYTDVRTYLSSPAPPISSESSCSRFRCWRSSQWFTGLKNSSSLPYGGTKFLPEIKDHKEIMYLFKHPGTSLFPDNGFEVMKEKESYWSFWVEKQLFSESKMVIQSEFLHWKMTDAKYQ